MSAPSSVNREDGEARALPDNDRVEMVARAMWDASSLQSWDDADQRAGACRITSHDRQVYRDHARAAIAALFASPVAADRANDEQRADDDDPCSGGAHCCCCGPGDPCCDCGAIMPSRSCIGEKCWCGAPAAKKVGEEALPDEPANYGHNLTAYVCATHYAQMMGPAGAQQVGVAFASPVAGGEVEPYLVWSNEHQAWWGKDRCGYTRHIERAGRYDRAEALTIAGTRDGGWHVRKGNPDEIAIPERDAVEQYAAITAALSREPRS